MGTVLSLITGVLYTQCDLTSAPDHTIHTCHYAFFFFFCSFWPLAELIFGSRACLPWSLLYLSGQKLAWRGCCGGGDSAYKVPSAFCVCAEGHDQSLNVALMWKGDTCPQIWQPFLTPRTNETAMGYPVRPLRYSKGTSRPARVDMFLRC